MKSNETIFFFIAVTVLTSLLGCSHSSKIDSSKQSINRDQVRQEVRKRLPDFSKCYAKEIETSDMSEGRVNLKWQIHEGGVTKNVKINETKSTLRSPTLDQCMIDVMTSIIFPAPPVGTIAEVAGYPFVFSKTNAIEPVIEPEIKSLIKPEEAGK